MAISTLCSGFRDTLGPLFGGIAAGVIAGGVSGAVASSNYYIPDDSSLAPLLRESPLAGVFSFAGLFAGTLSVAPLYLLNGRFLPHARSMMNTIQTASAVAASLLSTPGLDVPFPQAVYTAMGIGGAIASAIAAFTIIPNLEFLRNKTPEESMPLSQILPPRLISTALACIGIASGVLAGSVSGFISSKSSQWVSENSPLITLILLTAIVGGCTAVTPCLLPGLWLEDQRRLIRMIVICIAIVAAIWATQGLDMSTMRATSSGGWMGAAIGSFALPITYLYEADKRDLSQKQGNGQPLSDSISKRKTDAIVSSATFLAAIVSGALSGALSAELGKLTEKSFAAIFVPIAGFYLGTIAGTLPSIGLIRLSPVSKAIKERAPFWFLGVAVPTSAWATTGVDMGTVQSMNNGIAIAVALAVAACLARMFGNIIVPKREQRPVYRVTSPVSCGSSLATQAGSPRKKTPLLNPASPQSPLSGYGSPQRSPQPYSPPRNGPASPPSLYNALPTTLQAIRP